MKLNQKMIRILLKIVSCKFCPWQNKNSFVESFYAVFEVNI
jgi:hypothetical protein